MKTATIGIIIMFIAWAMTTAGNKMDDLGLLVCGLPVLVLGMLVYYSKPKPLPTPRPLNTVKRPDEQHWSQWAVKTQYEMERNGQQGYNWRDHSMRISSADIQQFERDARIYMNMPMNQWPKTLHITLKAVGIEAGHSDDVIYETIVAWLKAGGNRTLTYQEVLEQFKS